MFYISLKKDIRNSEVVSSLSAQVEEGKLAIGRCDYDEWGRNRGTGEVETSYCFDVENTRRFMFMLGVSSEEQLLAQIKTQFTGKSVDAIVCEIKKYCEANAINYSRNIWY